MKNIARGFMLILALAAWPADKGVAQTPAGTAPASAAVANPVPYAWPSATMATPYPTLSLPRGCAPSGCTANEDNNGQLLHGDPLLDSNNWVTGTGWFGAVEVDPVGPAVKNRLNSIVPVGPAAFPATVQLPGASLNWTAMPHVELGYRLGQAAGDLVIGYRGLMYVPGTSTVAGFDAAGATAPLTSHLSMNVIDLDYASRENSLGPLWDMKWRTGVRIATVFFDSTASTPLLTQRESNNFVGAGLHFGLSLKRRLADTGLSLIGQIDGGAVLGQVHQRYSAILPGVGSGESFASANEPAPTLEVRLGLEWSPEELPNFHISTGYMFERWWTVGETFGTYGEVTIQGVFIRGEWRF
jgi:hypothetical protein